MGHLKKSDLTGHLLKNAAGHLVNGCAGAPVNNCNACIPPIPDTLYVTFDGLTGDFATFNGIQTCVWRDTCLWSDEEPVRVPPFNDPSARPIVYIEFKYIPPHYYWWVWLRISGAFCYLLWSVEVGQSDYCIPNRDYGGWNFGSGGGCVDTDSAADSVGATCVVSYT